MPEKERQLNGLDPSTGNGISCFVYSSFDEIKDMQQEWDEFVESVDGDIYLTYDWCRVWWQFYGKGRVLRIFIYKKNTKIIGLVPIFYEKVWLGPVWLRLAKIVGSDFTMAMINPPVQADFAVAIFKSIFASLIQSDKCDAIWLGPIGGKYNALQQLQDVMQNCSGMALLRKNIRSPYTTFPLPKKFDEYIQSLNKRQRGNLRRDLNLIDKSFQMTQDVIQDDAVAISEFEKFVQMHTKQWELEGKLGHYHDWPQGLEFNTKLVIRQAGKGRLRLIRLMADGKVVSYQLCYAFGKRWHWRLPARLVGPDWDKFALGRIGLIKEIEMAIDEGVQEIEAGAGHYEYKLKLGGQELPLYSFVVAGKGLFRRWRILIFIELSNLLHFVYYKAWFNRLAPKLPFKRKPLWMLWIRTRL